MYRDTVSHLPHALLLTAVGVFEASTIFDRAGLLSAALHSLTHPLPNRLPYQSGLPHSKPPTTAPTTPMTTIPVGLGAPAAAAGNIVVVTTLVAFGLGFLGGLGFFGGFGFLGLGAFGDFGGLGGFGGLGPLVFTPFGFGPTLDTVTKVVPGLEVVIVTNPDVRAWIADRSAFG